MTRKTEQESPLQNSPSVDLRIETLVFHGLNLANRYHIGQAVERELTRRFSQDGTVQLLASDGAIDQLDGGSFQLTPEAREDVIGAQLAQAVYAAIQTTKQHE